VKDTLVVFIGGGGVEDATRGENEADGETSAHVDGTVGRAASGSVSVIRAW
jgi:hypothetical protein